MAFPLENSGVDIQSQSIALYAVLVRNGIYMLFSVLSASFTPICPRARILAVGARGVKRSESSRGLEMLSQAARVEWDPVLLRSTSHQVLNFVLKLYTWYIPGIYQHQSIYLTHTWYISNISWYIPGIYQVYTSMMVYTWYIPGIYRLSDHIGDMPGIY